MRAEILEVTSDEETAVCNLGSINLGAHLGGQGGMDWERLRATVRTAVTFLDRVIDINYCPTEQAARSNPRWRPVGLGVMDLQDVFFIPEQQVSQVPMDLIRAVLAERQPASRCIPAFRRMPAPQQVTGLPRARYGYLLLHGAAAHPP